MLTYTKYLFLRSRSIWSQRPRVILDCFSRLGNFEHSDVGYRTYIYKEQLSRDYVLAHTGTNLKFLDMGGKDGELTYLLGIHQNLAFEQDFYDSNKSRFDNKYEYFGVDLHPAGTNVLTGDICSRVFFENYQD